jgi:hypothetical protein
MQDQSAMENITKNLTTKSDKIRRLNAAGYPRQAIADFLGIRYQHVRNVLVDEERTRQAGFSEGHPPKRPALAAAAVVPTNPGKVLLRQDGSIVLPPSVLTAAGYKSGDTLFVRAEGEGEIQLLSGKAAIRRAQELVREFVGENVSLVDELLKERRHEAENE